MADGAVNLTIDGMPVSAPPGTLLIEAAKQAGVLVPHYCYHPGLPVAGLCRMCLVEVEKAPKLQIACATPVAEGMVVHTQSAQAKSARMGVLELLLINHPLDCPICDQAGECELQDFTFQEGRPATRYSPDYAKRFNPVEDFGPDVLYVPNRCFICDHGRMNYRWMNRGDRIEAPRVKRGGGELQAVDWDEALERTAGVLRGAGGRAVTLASPRMSTEALFLARELCAGLDWTGAVQIVMGEEAPLAGVPNPALRPERAPNGTGAELLGYGRDYAAALQAAESAAGVVVLDEPEVTRRTSGALIHQGPGRPDGARNADVVLPIANVAEEEGTFVNRDGRVQRYFQAKPAPGMARPAWWVLAELLTALGRKGGESLTGPGAAFDRLARSVGPFAGLSYASIGAAGQAITPA